MWRSLSSVMLLTLHVAVVATVIRYLNSSSGRQSSLMFWVAVAIGFAIFVSSPIACSLFSASRGELPDYDRACPFCRRVELRPLFGPGRGIFDPVTNYRCAGCWTTVRIQGDSRMIEEFPTRVASTNRSGIQFLDESSAVDEIIFLDESTKSIG